MKLKETERLEFKKSTSELKEAIVSIAAMLNKHKKGKLIFGVKSNGEVVGQNVNEKTLRDVSKSISDHIEPKIFPKVCEEEIDGESCVVVEFEGGNAPYFAYGRAYARVSDEDRLLSAKELEKLILKKSRDHVPWDYEICNGAKFDDLDEKVILQFRSKYEEINKIKLKGLNKDLLKSLGCLREVDEKLKITNAGILLFSNNSEKFFPMNYVTIARYPGVEKGNDYLDIKDFYGNLFDLVDKVDKYIKENIQERSKIVKNQIPRKIISQYPYYAIREVITNALIHRDYSIKGSRIIIRMFKDRIEFNSPGELPANITPENIVYEQYSRNPILSKVLEKIKYIEKMGEGWDKIIDSFEKSKYKTKLPNILDTGNTVIVTFFSPKEMVDLKKEKVGEKWGEKWGEKLSENQKKIISLMNSNKFISIVDIARQLKLGTTAIEKNLKKLKEKGLLERVGGAKGGFWKVE